MRGRLFLFAACAAALLRAASAEEPREPQPRPAPVIEKALRGLDTRVAAGDGPEGLSAMLAAHVREGIAAANRRETRLWRQVKSRADWERYREARLAALRESLGMPASRAPRELAVHITGAVEGEGYRIENLVFESRPGLLVTANLYLPSPAAAAPLSGILLCHSHHHPKEEAELQEMGVSWARAGSAVLVMDQLGHGERRQHPFGAAESYPRPFRAGRQDYWFRYDAGMQLHVAGESLIGWMVEDLLAGVDLLLARPGIDARRIFLLGSVAGGGDPAALAAALDERIAAAVPFNFGGPQPETPYPLPGGAEESFDYTGSGSWESTRNLRLSARDGFLPWAITAAIAPRGLVYAHEFSWDRERDPVWRRLEAVYELHGARERLAFAHGRGLLSGRPPEASHCTNIGAEHRRFIHEAFERWFGIEPPKPAAAARRRPEELRCLTDAVRSELRPRPLHELLLELGGGRMEKVHRVLASLSAEARRGELRRRWAHLLGEPEKPPVAPRVLTRRSERLHGLEVERILLETEERIAVPLLLLVPETGGLAPVVVAFAEEGKETLLDRRRRAVAALLEGGAAVCLADLRGCGETRPAGSGNRGRRGAATAISSSYLMLGRTLIGARLRDLRTSLELLRGHPRIDGARLALWGDSFAPANPSGRDIAVPHDAEPPPAIAEPLGGIAALLAALFEERLAAVYARGGLESYASLLESPFVCIPHDVIVPGALLAGDLPAIAAILPAGRFRSEDARDGRNRAVSEEAPAGDGELARWMLSRLQH